MDDIIAKSVITGIAAAIFVGGLQLIGYLRKSRERSGGSLSTKEEPAVEQKDEQLPSIKRYFAERTAIEEYNLGVRYQTGKGVRQDYTQAARHYGYAAQLGHAVAQTLLGGFVARPVPWTQVCGEFFCVF
jgi:hypothetical protein